MVPFPDAPQAHHESQVGCGGSRLVGVGHNAGVAQRRTFNGVLAGECRTQQQHSRLGELVIGVQAIREFTGVPAEGANKIAVTAVEAEDDIVQRRPHVVLVEGQDARQDRSRSGLLVLETLLAGHEQSGDDPRRVGREPLAGYA